MKICDYGAQRRNALYLGDIHFRGNTKVLSFEFNIQARDKDKVVSECSQQ
jgi:hypothetical protein